MEDMKEVKLSLAQKTKAKILTEGLKIPKASLEMSVDATEIRPKIKEHWLKLDAIFLVAMAEIIYTKMPHMNVSWAEDGGGSKLMLHEDLNFGFAIQAKSGLTVVTIKDVEHKNIWQLNSEIKELAEKAKNNRLGVSCFEPKPNIVFNNVGVYPNTVRGDSLMQPWNTLMISAFSIIDNPVVFKGYIMSRPMMNVCLFFDHRSIDGDAAALFLNLLKEKLENFN